jgi:hypothetical protein
MKPRSHPPFAKPLALAATLLAAAFASLAAQTHTNAPAASSPAPTNAPPSLPAIPQSVFIIPATPQEGKDPFFPLSMRPFTTTVVRTNLQPTVAVAVTVDLKLNGISGTAARRLAIINNRTFEANEEGVVSTTSGPVRIRCLEIKDDSVLVQVGGEQRVLRLRPGS